MLKATKEESEEILKILNERIGQNIKYERTSIWDWDGTIYKKETIKLTKDMIEELMNRSQTEECKDLFFHSNTYLNIITVTFDFYEYDETLTLHIH